MGLPLLVALLICYFGKNALTSQSGFFYHLKTPRSGFASITAHPSVDSACVDMLITGDFASVPETMLEGVCGWPRPKAQTGKRREWADEAVEVSSSCEFTKCVSD